MKTKEFDAVTMMRSIRDELSEKFMHMSFKEQKEYIRKNLEKTESG